MRGLLVTKEQTVKDLDGKILHFGVAHFRRDIAEGDCCFMCGASPTETKFNDEHVIPDWVLRRFELHDRAVTLPNGAKIRYSQYRVPCCVSCNSYLGENLETPVSNLIAGGYSAVAEHLTKKGPLLLYLWLNLVFLKTHLKDRALRYHLDARLGTERISEQYDWGPIHHIHCVARAQFTGAKIDPRIGGTFLAFPAKLLPHLEKFDYVDLVEPKAIMVQLGDVALISVLDDAGAVASLLHETLEQKIKGALSPLQLREVLAHCALARLRLANEPSFHTDFESGTPILSCEHDSTIRTLPANQEVLGKLMHYLCADLVKASAPKTPQTVFDQLRAGKLTFVSDNDGNFRNDSMDLV